MLSQSALKDLRITLYYELNNYTENDHIKLNMDNKILREVLLKNSQFTIPFDLVKKLDLTGFDFGGFDITGLDFTGSYGVSINPQTVKYKDLSDCILNGVTFKGPFDNTILFNTDFTGSKEAIINPQKIKNKNMCDCKFSNVKFDGYFDDILIVGSDFTGSINANIDPDKIAYKNLADVKLKDARVLGGIADAFISGTDFTGTINTPKILVEELLNKDMSRAILNGARLFGSFDGVNVEYTNFSHSEGAILNVDKIYNKSLRGTKLADATISFSNVIDRRLERKLSDKKLKDLLHSNNIDITGTAFYGCNNRECSEYISQNKELIKRLRGSFKK